MTKTKQNKQKRKILKEATKNNKNKLTVAIGVAMVVAMGTTKAIVMVKSWWQNVTFTDSDFL